MALIDAAVDLVDETELHLECAVRMLKDGELGQCLSEIDAARQVLVTGVQVDSEI